MIAFVVAALMGIMLIHILMESIPALREVGIKMFLPSSEWRPVSAAPQYGLLPAVTGTLYVSGLAVLFAMILGCLLYTSPSPRDRTRSRMPSSA